MAFVGADIIRPITRCDYVTVLRAIDNRPYRSYPTCTIEKRTSLQAEKVLASLAENRLGASKGKSKDK